MSEKLTAEWCEEQAAEVRAYAADDAESAAYRERAAMVAEALMLASRALKAREWCARNHDTAAVAIVAAILDGVEP